MSIIVLDTETTGIPVTPSFGKYYHPSDTNKYTLSRVIQIAVVAGDYERVWYIRPDGWTIMNSHIHGITQEIAEREGVTLSEAIAELVPILRRYKVVVGHNIAFDRHVLASEMYRYGLDCAESFYNDTEFTCTMQMSQTYHQTRRWIKLEVLYRILIDPTAVQTHDALDDCRMAYDVYWVMRGKELPRLRFGTNSHGHEHQGNENAVLPVAQATASTLPVATLSPILSVENATKLSEENVSKLPVKNASSTLQDLVHPVRPVRPMSPSNQNEVVPVSPKPPSRTNVPVRPLRTNSPQRAFNLHDWVLIKSYFTRLRQHAEQNLDGTEIADAKGLVDVVYRLFSTRVVRGQQSSWEVFCRDAFSTWCILANGYRPREGDPLALARWWTRFAFVIPPKMRKWIQNPTQPRILMDILAHILRLRATAPDVKMQRDIPF